MHRRYYILIISWYNNISNIYSGYNIAGAHRPTIPFLPRGPLARQSPRRALRRPVILPGTPQVVIPHVAPCTCTLVRKGRPASRAWCPAGPPGGVGLEVTGHPEGVGDPEKALRLAFKALQPLNPPRGAAEGRTACPGRFCGPYRRGMILAVGEDGWARGRVLPVRSDHPPVRHSADHAAAGEAGAGPWRCCLGWAPC